MDHFMIDPKGELKRIDETPVIIENKIEYQPPQTEYPVYQAPIEPEQKSFLQWTIFIPIVLILFIAFSIYYAFKYAINEKHYIIKQNAKTYKLNLEEMKYDIKNWLRTTYGSIQEYIKTIFNVRVENGTFKVKRKKANNLVGEEKDE